MKSVLLWALAAVVVLWMIHDPGSAAGVARGAGHFAYQAATGAGTFLSSLAHG